MQKPMRINRRDSRKAPCQNCPDRKAACHSTCPSYLSYKKEAQETKEKKIKATTVEAYIHNRRYK